jgi:hypothetical protein
MHFIERLSGIVPDGGNGSLELLVLLALLTGIALVIIHRRDLSASIGRGLARARMRKRIVVEESVPFASHLQ